MPRSRVMRIWIAGLAVLIFASHRGASAVAGATREIPGRLQERGRDEPNPETPAARPRELGLQIGILPPGRWNAITDVAGVRVGHQTVIRGDAVRTGVTVVLPHEGNLFKEKVSAAVHVGNGFGKLAGATQVRELGTIEAPIALTNTLDVGTGVSALVAYTLRQPGNESVRSVNAVVGETNDGYLNDIRSQSLTESDFWAAIEGARSGTVPEGAVGAGTGTRCFGYKGGIGTSSRKLPDSLGGFTVGVLVQSNFGGILRINGAPVGRELGQFSFQRFTDTREDGSCMIVVATDAPLSARNLERLSRRALFGMARTGAVMSNGSGDYVVGFSTALKWTPNGKTPRVPELENEALNPLFLGVVEATEEAIYNSLFAARSMVGHEGHRVEALPTEKTLEILEIYRALRWNERLPAVKNPHP